MTTLTEAAEAQVWCGTCQQNVCDHVHAQLVAAAAELEKARANFARDQAELASMRISLAEAKADLEQAAKVAEELVDGLSEEQRRRNVAEVEVERLKGILTAIANRGQVGPPDPPGPKSNHWYALANQLGALAAAALEPKK
jgi:multidrug efflux pump subunit AcrA (membrane-fusion protein)